MRRKPILALTALGFAGILGSKCPGEKRWIAVMLACNAVLCHVCGHVHWDVLCNAALTVFVLGTDVDPQRLITLAGAIGITFLVNHLFVDSPPPLLQCQKLPLNISIHSPHRCGCQTSALRPDGPSLPKQKPSPAHPLLPAAAAGDVC